MDSKPHYALWTLSALLCASAQAAPIITPRPSALVEQSVRGQADVHIAPTATGLIIERRSIHTPPASLVKPQAQPSPIEAANRQAAQEALLQASPAPDPEPNTKPAQGIRHKPRPARPVRENERASYDRTVQAGIAAYDQQRYDDAYRILLAIRPQIEKLNDYGIMELLGLAASKAQDESTAIELLRRAATATGSTQTHQTLALSLLQFQRVSEALEVAQTMPPSSEKNMLLNNIALIQSQKLDEQGHYAQAEALLLAQSDVLNADGLQTLGWMQYHQGKDAQAASNFEAAYRIKQDKGSAQGLVFSLNRQGEASKLLALADELHGPLENELLAAPGIKQQLAEGETRFAVNAQGQLSLAPNSGDEAPQGLSLRAEPTYRQKKGDAGQGWLTQQGLAITTAWDSEHEHLKLRIEAERDDNQQTQPQGFQGYALWRHRADDAIEYRIGLGSTPSGGAVNTALLGELGLGRWQEDFGAGMRLFRRGNIESLLALSGMTDAQSGYNWGRVLETGMDISAYTQRGEWNALASMTASELRGEYVATNHKLDLYARALRTLQEIEGLRLGSEMYASHFAQNLSYFEPGHGGYFSPERFIKLGVVADYNATLKHSKLHALLGAGWAWSRQATADGNPITGAEPAKYAASSSSGLAYHGQLDIVTPLDTSLGKPWSLGFSLGGQNSPDYSDWFARIYLQYAWQP